MKPVIAHLHKKGIVQYLDDFFFLINRDKCEFISKQNCTFLGLFFSIQLMTVSISYEKRENCVKIILELLNKTSITIRYLAKVMGTLISVCPAIKYGILYTKELFKLVAKKYNKFNHIYKKNMFKITIFMDASNMGWEASCDSKTTSGSWTLEKSELYINSLKLLAVYFGLKMFLQNNLGRLTQKKLSLLALATGQRAQTISLIKIKNISVKNNCITIKIEKIVKTAPNRCQPLLTLPFYNTRHASCSVALKRGVNIGDIRRTAGWTGNSNILLHFIHNRAIINNTTFAQTVFE
ncbi:hypothetical protein K1T71_006700 [Dendrolimus kikuchii]|uniref:Uncharacterized protein n=1 Tax=Dendrolimus kikuchii TaxID=765133 RepID=A0ACC1D1W1_9NEOP|nr:hypothetical protein K1T71_006700 [Dendrolimus kikuchii]